MGPPYQVPQTGCLKQQSYCLIVLEAGSLKSRCRQGCFLLRPGREGSAPISPWFVDACLLPVSSHYLPSVCVCVPVSPFYDDTSHIGLGPTLMTPLLLDHLCKNPSPHRSHSEVLEVRTTMCLFLGGDTNLSQQRRLPCDGVRE